jgi:hypothetical protein
VAEHKDRPEPQRATGRKENDAKPAESIAVEGPEPNPVRIGRQKPGEQPEQRKSCDDQRLDRSMSLSPLAAWTLRWIEAVRRYCFRESSTVSGNRSCPVNPAAGAAH